MKSLVVQVGSGVVPIPPEKGGATEKLLWEFSRRKSAKTEIIVMDNETGVKRKGIEYVKVRRFGGKFSLRLTEFLFGMKCRKKILETNKKTPVSVVHCHTPFTALPFAFFGLPENIKTVYTCHNPVWTVDSKEVDFMNRMVKRVEGYVMKKFDKVTAETTVSVDGITKRVPLEKKKCSVVTSFLDYRKFSSARKNYIQKRYGRKKSVLFLSKLNRIKGVDTFIKASAIVKRSVPDATFFIAGPASFEGDESDAHWRVLAKELGLERDVIFTGPVPEDDLPDLYASADVFCLPTKREIFGLVVAEAMAAGTPVVTSDIPVLKEVTGGKAIYAKKDDYGAFAKGIVSVLKNLAYKRKLGRELKLQAKRFDKEYVMSKFEELYLEMVNEK